jgi:molybdopterin-guanine dinucleotide biosynthesis adapter protein
LTRKVIGIAGYKKSGKTTLVERLVREFTDRGLVVASVKHAHHAFDIDHKGRDSWRHRAAGAREVAIVSDRMWAIIHSLHDEPEPRLDEVLAKMAPCDLVVIEGYKREELPQDRGARPRPRPSRPGSRRSHGDRHCGQASLRPTMLRCRCSAATTSPALADFIADSWGLGALRQPVRQP